MGPIAANFAVWFLRVLCAMLISVVLLDAVVAHGEAGQVPSGTHSQP